MDTIVNKEAALLGLLAETPMHPYKIEKAVEHRDMRSWTDLSMSTIYKTLRSLEKRGFVSKEVKINEKNVAQKLYSITERGFKALQEKVSQALSVVEPLKLEINIALYNLPVLKKGEVIDQLKSYIGNLEECINGYKALEAFLKEEGCQTYVHAVAVRPQYVYKPEIQWAKDFIEIVKKDGDKWKVKK